jgi:serine/threonine protein kinase
MGETFDWASRLGVAASIAEALAFMHQELKEDGIAHGNLKSSNILLNKNMEPCISEYGLMAVDSDQYGSSFTNVTGTSTYRDFNRDIYGFGVILLELLTGKPVQNNGVELADWVHSVVQEEWTVEVFDKSLISEGASEERMVNLLQVAIKCVDHSPEGRPSMNQVSVIINTIKEEDDRSIAFEASQG